MYIKRHKSQIIGGNNHQVISIRLLDEEIEQAYRIREEEYRRQDVKNAIKEMYNAEDISEEEYQQSIDNEGIINEIMSRFEKTCSCNVAYNVTMEEAVKYVLKELV